MSHETWRFFTVRFCIEWKLVYERVDEGRERERAVSWGLEFVLHLVCCGGLAPGKDRLRHNEGTRAGCDLLASFDQSRPSASKARLDARRCSFFSSCQPLSVFGKRPANGAPPFERARPLIAVSHLTQEVGNTAGTDPLRPSPAKGTAGVRTELW